MQTRACPLNQPQRWQRLKRLGLRDTRYRYRGRGHAAQSPVATRARPGLFAGGGDGRQLDAGRMLGLWLQALDHAALVLGSPQEALARAESAPVDVFLLDIGLQ